MTNKKSFASYLDNHSAISDYYGIHSGNYFIKQGKNHMKDPQYPKFLKKRIMSTINILSPKGIYEKGDYIALDKSDISNKINSTLFPMFKTQINNALRTHTVYSQDELINDMAFTEETHDYYQKNGNKLEDNKSNNKCKCFADYLDKYPIMAKSVGICSGTQFANSLKSDIKQAKQEKLNKFFSKSLQSELKSIEHQGLKNIYYRNDYKTQPLNKIDVQSEIDTSLTTPKTVKDNLNRALRTYDFTPYTPPKENIHTTRHNYNASSKNFWNKTNKALKALSHQMAQNPHHSHLKVFKPHNNLNNHKHKTTFIPNYNKSSLREQKLIQLKLRHGLQR